jgi:glutamine amidotransferase
VKTPRVAVLDYGCGNLHSVANALNNAGAQAVLSANLSEIDACDALVIPGVGAFAACMSGLRSIGGDDLIRRWLNEKRPVLGICVGHQVMFESGIEHNEHTLGVGVLRGNVEQLQVKRLPHMGWNTLNAPKDTRVFAGIENERFYFVHSYAVVDLCGAGVTFCEHAGVRFVAAVERETLTSVQFHPEKSGKAGERLLRNWLCSFAPENFNACENFNAQGNFNAPENVNALKNTENTRE